jgi:hypothetical protein
MAHQSHNISYSRYRKLMEYRYIETKNGSNHKNFPNFEKELEFLKNEFIEIIVEFGTSLKQKIKESDIYLDEEYENIMKEYIAHIEKEKFETSNGTIIFVPLEEIDYYTTADNLENQLFITLLNGDIKLIKTFIVALTTKTKIFKPSSFAENRTYGQFWIGGLTESFHSFIFSYLLLNTYLSYEDKLKNTIIKFKNIRKYCTFGGAFEYSCNLLNKYIQKSFWKYAKTLDYDINNEIYAVERDDWNIRGKKYVAIFCNTNTEHLQKLLKEMFRLMYYSFAMIIYDSDDIRDGIEKVKYAYERCVHF